MVQEENDQGSLSETERHWDQACLTIVTIATAALAAVFFVSGLGKPANDPGNSLTLIPIIPKQEQPTGASSRTGGGGPAVLGEGRRRCLSGGTAYQIRKSREPGFLVKKGDKMLLKSVYQWDIDSADDLAKFREDSGQIDQQVERVIYRRSDNITPGELVEMPQTQSPAPDAKPCTKTENALKAQEPGEIQHRSTIHAPG